jgi:hypothetical protein
VRVTVIDHPLAAERVGILRDKSTANAEFPAPGWPRRHARAPRCAPVRRSRPRPGAGAVERRSPFPRRAQNRHQHRDAAETTSGDRRERRRDGHLVGRQRARRFGPPDVCVKRRKRCPYSRTVPSRLRRAQRNSRARRHEAVQYGTRRACRRPVGGGTRSLRWPRLGGRVSRCRHLQVARRSSVHRSRRLPRAALEDAIDGVMFGGVTHRP